MGKLVLKDEPLTHDGRLAPCGKWVEADDCFMHGRAHANTNTRDLNCAVKALAF